MKSQDIIIKHFEYDDDDDDDGDDDDDDDAKSLECNQTDHCNYDKDIRRKSTI